MNPMRYLQLDFETFIHEAGHAVGHVLVAPEQGWAASLSRKAQGLETAKGNDIASIIRSYGKKKPYVAKEVL
jgi:hypothetical protein